MTRPGRFGEDPEAIRPRVKLVEWNAFTVQVVTVLVFVAAFLFAR